MPTTLTVTRTTLGFAPGGDLDGDGQYDPGDIIMIRIRVANSGAEDALDVSVTDTVGEALSGLTQTGNATVSPIPFADAYALTGNTPITISAAAGVLINDTDPGPGGNAATLAVTLVNGVDITLGPVDVGNGVVAMNADGGFTFTPDAGFEGDVTFTYTAQDAEGLTNPVGGSVTMTVGGASGLIWYVDSLNGSDVTGDGTYDNPFATLAPLSTGGSADALDDPGHTIFVYDRGTTNAGALVLEDGQRLIGDGGPTEFMANGLTISAAGGNNTVIGAATFGVTLAQNNTINGISFDGTATTAVAIQDGGGSVGTLTITNTGISGSGQAIDIDNGGVLNVSLGTLSSSNATGNAVHLSGDATTAISGSFSASSGVLTGAGATAFLIGDGVTDHGGTVAVSYGGDISATVGAVRIVGRDAGAGAITFSGAITQSGAATGIQVQTIDSGTISFTGNKSLTSTGAFDGVSLTGLAGGTVNLTTGSFTIDTVDGHGIAMSAITGGSVNLSASGALDIDVTGVGRGVSILGAGAASSGAAGTVAFNGDLDITTADGVGLRADITGGTFLNLGSPEAGTKSITTGVGGTAAGAGSGGALVVLNNVQIGTLFDIDTLNATESVNGIGVSLTNVDSGTFDGGALTVAGATNDGVNISGGTSSNVTFASATIGTSAIVSGEGIEIDTNTGTVTFGTVDIDKVGGVGLRLINVANSVAVNGGSIGAFSGTSVTGDGVNVTGGSGNVTVAASVNKGIAGNVVEVNDHDGGTVTFSGDLTATGGANNGILVTGNDGTDINFTGQTIALTTGANTAVNLTTNAGSTIDFAPAAGGGGLDIATTTGTGFSANGGGTVTVTQNGTAGVAGNTINSTSGTALNIANTNIGAANVTFQSISSGAGANVGVSLISTGSSGGLIVTGSDGGDADSFADAGSGGTIAGKTGADGSTNSGIGIYLNGARDVSLSGMQLNDHQNFAIRSEGSGVTNFVLTDTVVNGANGTTVGGAGTEAAIRLSQVFGTGGMSRVTVSGGIEDNVRLDNSSGTLTSFVVSDSSFLNNSTVSGNVGFHALASGTSDMTVIVQNSFFQGNRTVSLRGDAADSSHIDFSALGNTIVAGTGLNNQGNQGIEVSAATSATADFAVNNNKIGTDGVTNQPLMNTGINISVGGTAASGMVGTVIGNTVVNAGASFSGFGIRVFQSSASFIRALVDSNSVSNVGLDYGLLVESGGSSGATGRVDAQVTNNNVSVLAGALDAIRLQARNDSDMYAVVTGNTTNAGGTGFAGITLRQANTAQFNLEDDADGSAPELALGGRTGAEIDTYATAKNPGAPTVVVFAAVDPGAGGAGFFGVAAGAGNYPTPLLGEGVEPVEPLTPTAVVAPPESPTDDPTPPADDPVDPPSDDGDPVPPPTGDPEPPAGEDPENPDNPPPPAHPVIVDDNVLSQAELDYIKDAAIQRWADAGASEAQLDAMRATEVTVANMMGLYLGKSEPGSVMIDSDAAGYGWFLDHTPEENSEYVAVGERLYAKGGTDASGHMDLLTVLMHELGHQIGLADSYKAADVDELMYGYAAVGQRKEPEADDLDGADPAHEAHEAYALPAVAIGTLPVGQTVDVIFEATIDAQSNGLIVDPDNTATVTLSNGVAPSYSDAETLALDTLVLGGTVWHDNGSGGTANNGLKEGTEPGIDGVSVTLFVDVNADGFWDAGDTQVGVSQLTAGGGNYSFTGLAPGNYIVRIDQDNFDAGGNVSLVATPIASAVVEVEPDDNVDDDNNGIQAAPAGVTYSGAITIAYNQEPIPGTGNDTNNTVDFGFLANVPPSLAVTGAGNSYTEPAGPNSSGGGVIVLASATIGDSDDTNIESATVTVNDFVAGDVLSIDPLDLPAGISASYAAGTGILTLSGSATLADYELALEAVRFSHSGDNPTVYGTDNSRQIGFIVNDGDDSSMSQNASVDIQGEDDGPVNVAPPSFAATEDSPLVLAGISVFDPDSNSGEYIVQLGVDHGTLTIRTDVGGGIDASDITAGANNSAMLTVTATLAQINATLAAANGLTYTPAPDFAGDDALTISSSDGVTSGDTDVVALDVGPVNDAPVLTDANVVLDTQDEDSGAPSGAVGTLVSSLVDLSQPAGGLDNVADVDPSPVTGIAITAADSTSGSWFYSLDGGASWLAVGAVTDVSARLVAADSDNRLYFRPDPDFNGTADATFRAWDRTSGFDGGLADTIPNGGVTAFSATSDVATATVAAVNDPPTVGLSSLGTATEQVALDLKGSISVADVDSGSGTVTVTLASDYGLLTVTAGTSGALVSGSGTGTVTITGAIAEIQALLVSDAASTITFTADTDSPPASALVSVQVDDGGNFGSGGARTAAASGAIAITAVDDPLNAEDDSYALDEDTQLQVSVGGGVLANDFDPDQAALTASVLADVQHGTLVLNSDGSFTYTPDPDYSGPDAFSYTVSDGAGDSAAANVSITVRAVRDDPVANDDSAATDEEVAVVVNVLANDTDADVGDVLNITMATTPAHGSVQVNGNGTITYTPNPNFSGVDMFAYEITDDQGRGDFGTDAATVTVTVNPVNDAPTSQDASVEGSEDDPYVFFVTDFPFADAADSPANGLSGIYVESLPVEGQLRNNGVPVALNDFITLADIADGGFQFIPDPDEYSIPIGSPYASFDFRVADDGGTGNGGDDTADSANTMDIVIQPDNIPPVANDDLYEAWEDELLGVAAPGVLANDSDDGFIQPVTAELVTGPAHASSFVLNPDGSFSYTTTDDFAGEDSFTYRVWDGQFYSNTATVELKVFVTNDAPVGIDSNVVTSEDTTLVFVPSNFAYSDEEGDPLASVTIDTLPAAGTILLDGVAIAAGAVIAAADIAAGKLTFVPPANANGGPYTSFTFTVRDTGGTAHGGLDTDTAPNLMTITVQAVNDAATPVDDNYNVAEDSLLGVAAPGVLGNDTDLENDPLTAELVDGPDHASSFTFNANGSFSYQATADYNGPDSFTYRVWDGSVWSGPATVNLNVTPVDDPSVNQPDLFIVNENAVLSGLNLFGDNGSGPDADPDGPALAVTEVNGSALAVGNQITLASGALLTVNADGTFVYDPNGQFDSDTIAATGASNLQSQDSFTYKADNGNTVTVLVDVIGVRTVDDLLIGSAGNDVITDLGVNFPDSFLLQQGGNDTATGLGGNDGFYFGAAMDGNDNVNGGAGTDSVAVQGNYAGLLLSGMTNVEVFVALAGNVTRFGDLAGNSYDYDVTSVDANVAAGQVLTVIATGLRPGEDLAFNGAAETNGAFRMFAGQGNDALTGGAGSDGFFFGADGNLTGFDRVDGGGGVDSLALRGNYVGAGAVVFQPMTMVNTEVLVFLSGHTNEFGGPIDLNGFDYDVTLADFNVAGDQLLNVIGTSLQANESLRFDGRAELDGTFRILSGAGDDNLSGGWRDDTLYGGAGADVLDGWFGADTYLYRFASESTNAARDRIVWGAGDRIDLSLIDANAGTGANDAFTFIGTGAFTGTAGQLRYVMAGPNALVEGDVNGDGIADLSIQVDNHVPVAGDFVF